MALPVTIELCPQRSSERTVYTVASSALHLDLNGGNFEMVEGK